MGPVGFGWPGFLTSGRHLGTRFRTDSHSHHRRLRPPLRPAARRETGHRRIPSRGPPPRLQGPPHYSRPRHRCAARDRPLRASPPRVRRRLPRRSGRGRRLGRDHRHLALSPARDTALLYPFSAVHQPRRRNHRLHSEWFGPNNMKTRPFGGTMSTSRKHWKLFPILLAAGATLLHAQLGPVTITTNALPNGFLNTPYNFVLTANPPATNGLSYNWSPFGLPPGLILNLNTGAITGAPTAIGTFPVFISLTSPIGSPATVLPLTVTALVPPLQITTYPVLPQGTVGVAYSGSMGATGGAAPYTFAIISGALPAGLTFSPGGSFGGTPTAFGSPKFPVQVTDSAGGPNARDFPLAIAPAKLILTPPPLSNTILGTPRK